MQAKSDTKRDCEDDQTRWKRNREHWETTLDAENLGRETTQQDFLLQLDLFQTADVRLALGHLEPLEERRVLELGGGLGFAAILLARRGAKVIITDISHPRLLEAKRMIKKLGLEDRIEFVVALGEKMPFRNESFDRAWTKSVLIHTDRALASAECSRVLNAESKAAFIEPMDANPFVNLYRRIIAPGAWKDITTYFDPSEIKTISEGMKRHRKMARKVVPMFFLGFFASGFQFALRSRMMYRISENGLLKIDHFLFKLLPSLKRRAWFVVLLFRSK